MIRALLHRLGLHFWGPWKKRYVPSSGHYQAWAVRWFRRCKICGKQRSRR